MRNEGGGFAANIYEAMPEDGMQVTSHESRVTRGYSSLLSNFKLHGSGVVCSIPTLKRKSIAMKKTLLKESFYCLLLVVRVGA